MFLNIEKINFDALPNAVKDYANSVFRGYSQLNEVVESNIAQKILRGVVAKKITWTAIFDFDHFPHRFDIIVNPSDIFEGYVDNYKIGYGAASSEVNSIEKGSALWIHKVFSGVYNLHNQIDIPSVELLDGENRLFVEDFMDYAIALGRLMFFWNEIFDMPYLFEPYFAERGVSAQHVIPVPNDFEPMEVVELVTGLIEAKKLTGIKKIHYLRFAELLGVEIKYLDKYINDLQKRKHGNETPLFDECKTALLNRLQK